MGNEKEISKEMEIIQNKINNIDWCYINKEINYEKYMKEKHDLIDKWEYLNSILDE